MVRRHQAGTSTVTTTVEHDLSGTESGGTRTLEGTAVTAVKTAADGETVIVTTTLTPAMSLDTEDGVHQRDGGAGGEDGQERDQGAHICL